MKRIFRSFLLLLLLGPLAMAGESWSSHTRAGEMAFAYGRIETAEKEFQAALDLAKTFGEDDPRLEESLSNLARLYEHQGDLDRAEPLYQLELAAGEHRLGKNSPELLDTLAALARTAIPAGDHPVAMESLQRYLEIAGQLDEIPNEEQYRAVLSTLARMEAINEDGDAALRHQREATRLCVENPGMEDSEKIAALENLARMEFRFGSPEAGAKALHEEADIARGGEDPSAAGLILLEGASTALDAGAWVEAAELAALVPEEQLDEAKKLRKAEILARAKWKQVAISAPDLASLAAAAEDTPEREEAAEALEKLRVLEREQRRAGSATLDALVRLSLLRGLIDDALKYQEELLALQRAEGLPLIEALSRRFEILRLDPAYSAKAIEAGRELIAAQEQAWGEDSPKLLPTLKEQYNLLLAAREKKAARKLKKRIRKLER